MPRPAPRTLLLAFFLLFAPPLALLPPPPLPALGPRLAMTRCAVPVEKEGLGVACLAAAEGRVAQARGLRAGDSVPVDADGRRLPGPPGRMAPERLLAARVRIDVNRAAPAELVALPEVGPTLARRIVAARPAALGGGPGARRGPRAAAGRAVAAAREGGQ